MDTDQALSISVVVGLTAICVCGIVSVCYKTRAPRSHMKISRSDPDLTTILENSIPSASAKYIQPAVHDPESH
jgi:hypothetical protein